MIVRSKETRVRSIAGLFIFPTLNTFTDAEAEKLNAHPDFKQALELGTMEILEVESVDEEILDKEDNEGTDKLVAVVCSASADDARTLIKDILDKKQLEAIIDRDRRKSVITAAKKQLEVVTDHEDNDEDGDIFE